MTRHPHQNRRDLREQFGLAGLMIGLTWIQASLGCKDFPGFGIQHDDCREKRSAIANDHGLFEERIAGQLTFNDCGIDFLANRQNKQLCKAAANDNAAALLNFGNVARR